MPSILRLAGLAVFFAVAAGCSKPETQARAKDIAARPVRVEEVRRDAVKRSVDVVGTLAAVDQVTI